MVYLTKRWGGEEGGDWVFWYEFRTTIRELIDKFNIEPVAAKFLPQRGLPVTGSMARPWPCGGIKGPHLHFGGEVFDLDRQQWKLFTDNVIQECHARLESAKSLPLMVDSVAMLGEAVAALPDIKGPEKA